MQPVARREEANSGSLPSPEQSPRKLRLLLPPGPGSAILATSQVSVPGKNQVMILVPLGRVNPRSKILTYKSNQQIEESSPTEW